MGAILGLTYLVGLLATVAVSRYRAGLSQRGRLGAETILRSLPWFVTQLGVMFVWPAVLIVWLARGRPGSPWESVNDRGILRVVRVQ